MTPYGYKIEHGYAVLDPETAPKVKAFFRHYLEGLPVAPACQAAGVEREPHSSWKLLEDRRYLGDDFYPQMIDPEIFEAVQIERKQRNHNSPDQVHYENLPGIVLTQFQMKRANQLPKDMSMFPQLIYNCIEPFSSTKREEGRCITPEERERLSNYISFAMNTMEEDSDTMQ